MASAEHKCAELRALLTRAKKLHEWGHNLPAVTAKQQTLPRWLSPAPGSKRAMEAKGEAKGEASANLRVFAFSFRTNVQNVACKHRGLFARF